MGLSPKLVAEVISRRWPRTPRAGIILGTGLGGLAAKIETEAVIPYAELPGFPCTTAIGHGGRFVCGRLARQPVVAFDGRCHLYEGYTREQVSLSARVVALLGAKLLIVSNASGGLNPQFSGGDIMVIDDHLDLMSRSEFRRDLLSSRLHDMHQTIFESRPQGDTRYYDPALVEQALAIARRENFVAHRGTYVALSGPNYETRAEYRFLRRIGGDVVGMSTVPEVVAAASCGLPVLALSMVTNVARPDAPQKTSAEDVVAIAAGAEPRLRKIVLGVLSRL